MVRPKRDPDVELRMLAVRLPVDLIERIDALKAVMQQHLSGTDLSRTAVVKRVIECGLAHLNEQFGQPISPQQLKRRR